MRYDLHNKCNDFLNQSSPSGLSTLPTIPINSFDESLFEWRKLVPMVCYRSLTRVNLVLHVINKLLTGDFFE